MPSLNKTKPQCSKGLGAVPPPIGRGPALRQNQSVTTPSRGRGSTKASQMGFAPFQQVPSVLDQVTPPDDRHTPPPREV